MTDDELAQGQAAYYVDWIGRLLAGRQYEWARETLEGIAGTITATGRVTPGQKESLDHIVVGKLRHDAARSA